MRRDRADTADFATRPPAPLIGGDDLPAQRPSSAAGLVGQRLGAALTLVAGLAAAAFVSLISTATSAMAATALVVSGIGTPVFPDPVLSWALNGKFNGVDPVSGTPWKRVAVPWPAQAAPFVGWESLGTSVAVGTEQLYAQVLATPGAKTVVGVSAGSLVVDEVMRRWANDPAAPSKAEVNFVVIADGSQRLQPTDDPLNSLLTLSGYTYQPPPETQYDLAVVAGEYDGFADWPDKFNLVSFANALAGILVVHVPTYFADLSAVPEQNITITTNSKGGVTTKYLVPTERLPLVTLVPALAPIEASLREWVDEGYSRNDVAAVPVSKGQSRTTGDPAGADAESVPAGVPTRADSTSRENGNVADRQFAVASSASEPVADASVPPSSQSASEAVTDISTASPRRPHRSATQDHDASSTSKRRAPAPQLRRPNATDERRLGTGRSSEPTLRTDSTQSGSREQTNTVTKIDDDGNRSRGESSDKITAGPKATAPEKKAGKAAKRSETVTDRSE